MVNNFETVNRRHVNFPVRLNNLGEGGGGLVQEKCKGQSTNKKDKKEYNRNMKSSLVTDLRTTTLSFKMTGNHISAHYFAKS